MRWIESLFRISTTAAVTTGFLIYSNKEKKYSSRTAMSPETSVRTAHEMEYSVKKYDLLEKLSLTQGVVERKTTIPILSNLLFEAAGNRLSITATDLELSIRTSCEAKVKKDGAGTIPAKKLFDLVRLLPDEEIKFKLLENHWIQIESGRKKYKLVGMSKDNFPALPAFPPALVKIPAK